MKKTKLYLWISIITISSTIIYAQSAKPDLRITRMEVHQTGGPFSDDFPVANANIILIYEYENLSGASTNGIVFDVKCTALEIQGGDSRLSKKNLKRQRLKKRRPKISKYKKSRSSAGNKSSNKKAKPDYIMVSQTNRNTVKGYEKKARGIIIPAGRRGSKYKFTCTLDSSHKISEVNENNNSNSITQLVFPSNRSAYSKISLSSVSTGLQVSNRGKGAQFKLKIKNTGTFAIRNEWNSISVVAEITDKYGNVAKFSGHPPRTYTMPAGRDLEIIVSSGFTPVSSFPTGNLTTNIEIKYWPVADSIRARTMRWNSTAVVANTEAPGSPDADIEAVGLSVSSSPEGQTVIPDARGNAWIKFTVKTSKHIVAPFHHECYVYQGRRLIKTVRKDGTVPMGNVGNSRYLTKVLMGRLAAGSYVAKCIADIDNVYQDPIKSNNTKEVNFTVRP